MRTTFMVALSLWIATVSTANGNQTKPRADPPLILESMTGHDSFTFYCATCHGADGRGGGPTAAALRVTPPDLTLLTRRARGTLPRTALEAFVAGSGRAIPAHGSGDMPVWGPIFRSLDPSDIRVTVRIANLVDYLAAIQTKEP